jgi:hypothetical protein
LEARDSRRGAHPDSNNESGADRGYCVARWWLSHFSYTRQCGAESCLCPMSLDATQEELSEALALVRTGHAYWAVVTMSKWGISRQGALPPRSRRRFMKAAIAGHWSCMVMIRGSPSHTPQPHSTLTEPIIPRAKDPISVEICGQSRPNVPRYTRADLFHCTWRPTVRYFQARRLQATEETIVL